MLKFISKGQLQHFLEKKKDKKYLIAFSEIDDAIGFSELFPNAAIYYPWEILPFEPFYGDKEKSALRFRVLDQIINNELEILLTSSLALFQKCAPLSVYKDYFFNFSVGERYDYETLLKKLVLSGYERVYEVRYPGQFAVRGEIMDIFSTIDDFPYRIVFFDDEIEEIRVFNPETQLSMKTVKNFKLYPLKEALYSDKLNFERLKEYELPILELKNNSGYEGMEKDFPILYDKYYALSDFLTDEWELLIEDKDNLSLFLNGKLNVIKKIEGNVEKITSFYWDKIDDERAKGFIFEEKSEQLEYITEKFSDKKLIQKLTLWQNEGYEITIYFDNDAKEKRFFEKYSVHFSSINAEVKPFSGSYIDHIKKKVYISEKEISGRAIEEKNIEYAKGYNHSGNVLTDLKEGDLIVHIDYGIGIYRGVLNKTIAGKNGDFVFIEYKNNAKVYVPVNHLDKVEKYVGDKKFVKLNGLNDTTWKKTKALVKDRIREFAVELIKLQAKRKNMEGYVFSEDTDWQKTFEAEFPYTPTDDQLYAINEIKNDMMSSKVMDRLLCGDVGFGKTEVAMRAAFKAVQDGKQVVFLAPTTVLAYQHFRNFKDRMSDYPIEIAMLSRLLKPSEIKNVEKGLENGSIDIVIGTHKIFSKNVKFKDLGLLIIDEEQRFGVEHKEKLKMKAPNVDTLFLSATPIPRTLYMSLIGIMDLSRLDTPPKNRHPIRTRAIPFDEELLREIIFREVRRGGQLFFIHNRVADLPTLKERIERIVSHKLTVDYAHGKMSGHQIEKRIWKFMQKKTDILIATTIIENGIDIPNVNTIIINDADKFGLSQLYQLRGRVGRREVQAYAYLLVPDKLTPIAKERVNALLNFDHLGAGFEIAMRDLELRGAGNLLGKEQSGYMNLIGYELYMKILQETIAEERNEKIKKESKITIDLDIDAYIPDSYIRDGNKKIEFYKKIYAIKKEDDMEKIKEELYDRYGKIPIETENLFKLSKLRLKAAKFSIKSIEQVGKKFNIFFKDDVDMSIIIKLPQFYGKDVEFFASKNLKATLKNIDEPISALFRFFEILSN